MWNLYIEKFSHIDSSYVSLVPRHSPFLFSGLYLMLFYFYECKPKNFFSFKLGRSGDKATAMLQFIFVSAVVS